MTTNSTGINQNHSQEQVFQRDYKILFVCSSGKTFKKIPFITSQYQSLIPYIKVLDNYWVPGGGVSSYLKAYKELKTILKEGNYDIIHAHWVYAGLICGYLTKREKLVISFLGNDLQGIYSQKLNIITFKGLLNILLSQYVLYIANGVIVKSKRMFKWIPNFLRHKSHIIPNGVNLNKFGMLEQTQARTFLKLNHHKKYILFLGDTKDYNKNFKLLKDALSHLDHQKIEYVLLTPYPTESSLIPYYLAAANVLAFTSKIEGSPNVIKEAIAMRCPIVSTDVGDVKDRIENITGCHISKFKSLDFAEKLIDALNFNGRISVEAKLPEISETNIAQKLIQVYDKSLEV